MSVSVVNSRHAAGLVDELAAEGGVRPAAIRFAERIAASAPLAVTSIRATMRARLAEAVAAATARELASTPAQLGNVRVADWAVHEPPELQMDETVRVGELDRLTGDGLQSCSRNNIAWFEFHVYFSLLGFL